MEVFILGAGFSRAISDAMPLLSDLPRRLKAYGWDSDLDALLNKVNGNVEHLLTYLATDAPFLPEPVNLRNRASFLELSRSLGRLVASCEQLVLAHTPYPDWLRTLATRWDGTASPVLTFNYDTLVERAYEALGMDDTERRYAAQLYTVPLAPLHARGGTGWFGGGGVPHRSTFSLLKLHGSVNWLYSGSERFFGETIYSVNVSGWRGDDFFAELEKNARDKVPLVVPPTTDKSTFFANESVRSQWQQAALELDLASDLYFLGYSLPETDLLVRFLLSDLSPQTHIHVVNKLCRAEGDVRSDDEIRQEFVDRYHAAFPKHDVNVDFVRVDEDVLPDFVNDL